jgi:hypothetical protein
MDGNPGAIKTAPVARVSRCRRVTYGEYHQRQVVLGVLFFSCYLQANMAGLSNHHPTKKPAGGTMAGRSSEWTTDVGRVISIAHDSIAHDEAAVDVDRLTCHVVSIAASEKTHDTSHVVGSFRPAERDE